MKEKLLTLKKKLLTRKFAMECVRSMLTLLVIMSISWYVVPTFAAQRTMVQGRSMENNFHNGENVLLDKILYKFDGIDRFDVIVFYPEKRITNDSPLGVIESKIKKIEDEKYIKRVIGLPGETIQIVGADIFINGKILKENYGKMSITDEGIASEPITLGEDEYFVLGDNREISKDSREIGPVKKSSICGRVVYLKELLRSNSNMN